MKFQSSIRILPAFALLLGLFLFFSTASAGNEYAFSHENAGHSSQLYTGLATDTPTGVVTAGALNVRSGPGVSFNVITKIYNGQIVSLLGKYYANNWVNIRLSNGLEGWVNSVYLHTSVPVNSLPVIGAPPPTPTPPIAVTPIAVVTTGALNVRSGPSPTFQSLTVVYQGNQMTLIGKNSSGTWLKVKTVSNVEGWVNGSYVQTSVPVSSLPVVDAPVTTPTAIIIVSVANVRTGPGEPYNVIAVLYQGQSVRVSGRNEAGDWLQVILGNGQTGWITTASSQLNVPVSSLPIVEVQLPSNSATVNTGALNVRYGPGVSYNAFTVAYRGQAVSLIGRATNSTWVQIQTAYGAVGWVNSNYLLMSIPLTSLPIVF